MRRILVPIDTSAFTDAATRRACEVASANAGSVSGLSILDTEGVSDSTALPFHAEYLDYPKPRSLALLQDAAEKLNRELNQFREICREAKVHSEEIRRSGTPADAILDLGRFYDLLCIGLETHFHFETEEEPGDTLVRVLDGAPIPILAVPAVKTGPIQNALVTYDGSPAATRALHAFARFWPIHRPAVRLITCEKDPEIGNHLINQAQGFLLSHGVDTIQGDRCDDESVIEAANRLRDWSDLVVAGIRSKYPIQHLFVGSFIRHLVDQGDTALLLSQ